MFNRTLVASESENLDPQNIAHWDRRWQDTLTIVAIGIFANLLIISIPGFYSHDELDWQNRIARNDNPWSFGLGSITTSPFFRLLGTIFISTSLRLPLQPFSAHFTDVLLAVATACLVYRTVALFRPDRALAAAILLMLMPGFAFSAAWVAAGFDIQFAFWGAAYVLCAVQYWRGGHQLYLVLAVAVFAIALGCKRNGALDSALRRFGAVHRPQRIDRRKVAILAALTGGLIFVYLGLRAPRILRMSVSAEGGYRFGDSSQILENLLAYFGFPFAPGMVEIQSFPFWDVRLVARLIVPHLVLIGLILWRAGPKWALIYLVAFYATLLPVLPISKYETQYTYAGSITVAIALALLWERRWFVAVPVSALALILAAHALTIQLQMYRTGVCQTRALDTLKAVLKDTAPEAALTNSYPGRHPVVGYSPRPARQFLPPPR